MGLIENTPAACLREQYDTFCGIGETPTACERADSPGIPSTITCENVTVELINDSTVLHPDTPAARSQEYNVKTARTPLKRQQKCH